VRLEAVGKDPNKTKDRENKEYAKCFKLIQGLLVLAMYAWDFEMFVKTFFL